MHTPIYTHNIYNHFMLPLLIIITSIKIEGWSRDDKIKKYINNICRDNHIHYTFLRLVFSIIMHAPNLFVKHSWFSCGRHYCFCTLQKASVGMYSGCDYFSIIVKDCCWLIKCGYILSNTHITDLNIAFIHRWIADIGRVTATQVHRQRKATQTSNYKRS